MKYVIFGFLAFIVLVVNCTPDHHSQTVMNRDSVIVFENHDIHLGVKLVGGAYVDFHIKEKPVNPFGWTSTPEQMPENNQAFTFDGHFLCTGRWGAPSKGEIKAGIPHNGEVNTEKWILAPSLDVPGFENFKMSCAAPIEKLDVVREILIPEKGTYFKVRESFTNHLPVGRLTNVVQHGTIAAPFLSESTMINTNATLGFDQRTSYKYLEDSAFTWPNGKMADGSEVDLSKVISEKGYVTTHIFEDSIGWITALNPDEKLLLGYVWKTSDYPWLNVWHMSREGKPYVQGLEFGTTGLGQPYKMLTEENITFFGRNSFEYIDAGETMEKSWICFMITVPDSFAQVTALKFSEEKISVFHQKNTVEISGNFD